MTMKILQAPRGTNDILPDEQKYWRLFEKTSTSLAETFGYSRIDTPVIEDAKLFIRVVGESTDIIEKETYTFEDRGGDLITLRPEGTAPICRAYIQNGMHNLPQPVRLYYYCPVFRYDRPQAGRYREHHQFGIEVLGDSDSTLDAEVIQLAWKLLNDLGISNLTPLVNSVGDKKCRPKYISELKDYFHSSVVDSCPNCPRRLEENPLRLLDCKEKSCLEVISSAPNSVEYLCEECLEHWGSLLIDLKNLGVPYVIDNRLVRGLDYYTRTVFEIVPQDSGSQSTIAGGGRYDGLIAQLGGHPTPSIGFGMGIERVLLELKKLNHEIDDTETTKILIAYTDESSKAVGITVRSQLHRSEIASVLAPSSRSLKSQLRYASSIKASHAIIIGERELENVTVTIRDLKGSEQKEIPQGNLLSYFGKG